MNINLNLGALGNFCVDALNTQADGSVLAVNPRAGMCPVIQPPQTEPPGRQRAASVKYPNALNKTATRAVDLGKWDDLFGHRDHLDAMTPWPGAIGSAPAVVQFTGNGYVALEFTATRRASIIVSVASYYGALVDGGWSPHPGDFSNASTCGIGESFKKLFAGVPAPGQNFHIELGQTGYLNLRLHAPQTMSRTVAFAVTGGPLP